MAKIIINGTIDEELTENEFLELNDRLMQLGIENIRIDYEEDK